MNRSYDIDRMARNIKAAIKTLARRKELTTAYNIINQFLFEYRAEYARHIQDMADKGELVRTWNDYGEVFYSIA